MCWKTAAAVTDFAGITDTKADAQDQENAQYKADRAAMKASQDASPASYSSSSTTSTTEQGSADYSKDKATKLASLGGRTILTGGQGLMGKLSSNTASSKKKTLG